MAFFDFVSPLTDQITSWTLMIDGFASSYHPLLGFPWSLLLLLLLLLIVGRGPLTRFKTGFAKIPDIFARVVIALMVLGIVSVWVDAIDRLAKDQPAGRTFGHLYVAKTASDVVIGADELAQDVNLPLSASRQHLRFFNQQDQWSVANVSRTRQLELTYVDPNGGPAAQVSFNTSRFFLQPNDTVVRIEDDERIDLFSVQDISANSFTLELEPTPGVASKETLVFKRQKLQTPTPSGLAVCSALKAGAAGQTGWGSKILGAIPNPVAAVWQDVKDALLHVIAQAVRYEHTLPGFLKPSGWLKPSEQLVGRLGAGTSLNGITACFRGETPVIALADTEFSALRLYHFKGLGYALVQNSDALLAVDRDGVLTSLSSIQHPLKRTFLPVENAGQTGSIGLGTSLQGPAEYHLKSFIAGASSKYAVKLAPADNPLAAFEIKPQSGMHRLAAADTGAASETNAAADLQRWRNKRLEDDPNFQIGLNHKDLQSTGALWAAGTGDSVATAVSDGASFSIASLMVGLILFLGIFWFVLEHAKKQGIPTGFWRVFEYMARIAVAMGGVLIAIVGFLNYRGAVPDNLIIHWPYFAIYAWLFAVWIALAARGSTVSDGIVLLLWTLLMALGHTGLIGLSFAHEETRYYRFANGASLSLVVSSGMLIIASQFSPHYIRDWFQSFAVRGENADNEKTRLFEWFKAPRGLWYLFCLSCLCLIIWFLFGKEEGIAGFFQPSEAIKILFALFLGIAITFALGTQAILNTSPPPLQRRARGQRDFQQKMAGVFVPMAIVASLTLLLLNYAGPMIGLLGGGATAAVIAALFAYTVLVFFYNWSTRFVAAMVLVGVLLGVLLFVPIVKSDFSPALIIVFVSIITFAVALIIEVVVRCNDLVQLRAEESRKRPFSTLRPPHPSDDSLFAEAKKLVRRFFYWLITSLMHPATSLLVIPLTVGLALFALSNTWLSNVDQQRQVLLENIGSSNDVITKRVISWIELNAAVPPAHSATQLPGPVGVELPDTAFQAFRSRQVLALSPCRLGARLGANSSATATGINPAAADAEPDAAYTTWAKRTLTGLQSRLSETYQKQLCRNQTDNEAAVELAKTIPAVESDFIGSWLIAFYGRDGALLIAGAQILLVAAFLVGAIRILSWVPGQVWKRPVAGASAYACIALASIMMMQWIISWANALGIIPVMGQPATFAAHGISHTIFFGTPAVLFLIAVLRMRQTFADTKVRTIGATRNGFVPMPTGFLRIKRFFRKFGMG